MLGAFIPVIGAGKETFSSHFLYLYGNASDQIAWDIAFDSTGAFIICGDTGTSDGFVSKFDSDGVLVWAKGINAKLRSVAIDSSDDVLVYGYGTEPGYGGTDGVVVKLNDSDGALIWRREFGTSGNEADGRIGLDSSNNVYVAAIGDGNEIILLKWNSSGTLQWQRRLDTGRTDPVSLHVTSGGDCYVTQERYLAKWNTSGTIQFQVALGASSEIIGVTVKSGFIYLVAHLRFLRTIGAIKIQEGVGVTWARQIDPDLIPSPNFGGIEIDASDAVYIACPTDRNTGPSVEIEGVAAKWSSGGTLQWQRKLTALTGSEDVAMYSIALSGANMAIVGRTGADGQGGDEAFVMRVPNDGTLTRDIGNLSYAVSAFLESGATVSYTTSSLTEAVGGATEAAGSITVSDLTGFILKRQFLL